MIESDKTIVITPFCTLLVEASKLGVTKITKVRANKTLANEDKSKVLKDARIALEDFFAGNEKALDKLTLDIQGTDFQRKVWQALRKIPFGEVSSYGVIAKQIGNEKAARAVGTACGKNPLLLAIPCHRVLAADGGIGGFSAGLPLKKSLLQFETANCRD